jgi:hypothetical protein
MQPATNGTVVSKHIVTNKAGASAPSKPASVNTQAPEMAEKADAVKKRSVNKSKVFSRLMESEYPGGRKSFSD